MSVDMSACIDPGQWSQQGIAERDRTFVNSKSFEFVYGAVERLTADQFRGSKTLKCCATHVCRLRCNSWHVSLKKASRSFVGTALECLT